MFPKPGETPCSGSVVGSEAVYVSWEEDAVIDGLSWDAWCYDICFCGTQDCELTFDSAEWLFVSSSELNAEILTTKRRISWLLDGCIGLAECTMEFLCTHKYYDDTTLGIDERFDLDHESALKSASGTYPREGAVICYSDEGCTLVGAMVIDEVLPGNEYAVTCHEFHLRPLSPVDERKEFYSKIIGFGDNDQSVKFAVAEMKGVRDR